MTFPAAVVSLPPPMFTFNVLLPRSRSIASSNLVLLPTSVVKRVEDVIAAVVVEDVAGLVLVNVLGVVVVVEVELVGLPVSGGSGGYVTYPSLNLFSLLFSLKSSENSKN